jgi:leukotriene-A4 hydrolase
LLLEYLSGIANRQFLKAFHASVLKMASTRDPNTLSNYNEIRTTQVAINFDIDFERKRLAGNIILKMKNLADTGCQEIILDTR